MSRAKRLAKATDSIQSIVDGLRDLADNLNKENLVESVEKANELISNIDVSEIESLYEEIESWRSGLEGTNLENSQKYADLDECEQALEETKSSLDDLDSLSIPVGDKVEGDDVETWKGEIEDVINNIEQGLSEAENVSFPGMY